MSPPQKPIYGIFIAKETMWFTLIGSSKKITRTSFEKEVCDL